jgi:hypothetical protein
MATSALAVADKPAKPKRGRPISGGGVAGYESNPAQQKKVVAACRGIIDRLQRLASEQVTSRVMVETDWLEDLRNYHGKYEHGVLASLKDAKRSQAFVKLTRHKTNSWSARLSDLLFPTDDKNWGIKPTPLPTLAKAAKDAIAKAEKAIETANHSADPAQQERIVEMATSFTRDALLTQAQMDEVTERCEGMEKAIEDQLIEAKYAAQCRVTIEDGCRLGTGIMKGPITSNRLRQEWREQEGVWQLAAIPDPFPEARRVDPWHFFPDMSARTIEEAEFTFERHLPTKRDLRKLALKLGFDRDAASRLIEQGPDLALGRDGDHLALLRELNNEGGPIKDRYVMWEYHGSLECDEIATLLRALGKESKAREYEEERDPMEDYRVIVYFCGDELLKIAPEYPLDSGESLYSVWNFQRGETGIFGIGIPRIMADSQRALNGAWRMMMDNSGLSVGPQVVVDRTAIRPADGTWGIRPMKVWYKTTTALSPQNPPFECIDIPNNQAQLAGIIQIAKEFIDEETSMPTIAQGEQGQATNTLGGMSILFNSANVVFRRVVKSWDDDLTTPTIRRFYDWNMQFNPSNDIKGDMQVDARGTSVLLVREMQSQNLMQVLTNWTTHPVIGPMLRVREGLVKTFQTMMIQPDDILKSKEEIEEEERNAAEEAKNQPPEQSEAQQRQSLASMEMQGRLQIAKMQQDTELARIASAEKITVAEARLKYGIADMQAQSKERIEATNIAIEDQRAAQAEAAGRSPEEAVGQGVG